MMHVEYLLPFFFSVFQTCEGTSAEETLKSLPLPQKSSQHQLHTPFCSYGGMEGFGRRIRMAFEPSFLELSGIL